MPRYKWERDKSGGYLYSDICDALGQGGSLRPAFMSDNGDMCTNSSDFAFMSKYNYFIQIICIIFIRGSDLVVIIAAML